MVKNGVKRKEKRSEEGREMRRLFFEIAGWRVAGKVDCAAQREIREKGTREKKWKKYSGRRE